MDSSAVAARLAWSLGLADVESVESGLEFAVFRAATSDGQQRAPLLNGAGLPTPRPVSLVGDVESGLPVLVSQFVSADGSVPRPDEVGRFARSGDARAHQRRAGSAGPAARALATATRMRSRPARADWAVGRIRELLDLARREPR